MNTKKEATSAQSAGPFDPREYYRKKRNHFLSLWLEDGDIKDRIKQAAKAEGRTMNNFINTYIVPEMEAVLMQKEAARINVLPKTASQRLAEEKLLRR